MQASEEELEDVRRGLMVRESVTRISHAAGWNGTCTFFGGPWGERDKRLSGSARGLWYSRLTRILMIVKWNLVNVVTGRG